MSKFRIALDKAGIQTLAAVPEGAQALALAHIFRERPRDNRAPILVVLNEGARAARLLQALRYFFPQALACLFPSWDCAPYASSPPSAAVVAQRLSILALLTDRKRKIPSGGETPFTFVITTVHAALQRTVPKDWFSTASWQGYVGSRTSLEAIEAWAERSGYLRMDTVRAMGEYAVRGAVLDIFPPSEPFSKPWLPYRLSFFGNKLDSIRCFDPETQRGQGTLTELTLLPISEIILDPPSIAQFRQGYLDLFGNTQREDESLYAAVSAGQRFYGMEHWLPLFYACPSCLLEFFPTQTPVVLEAGFETLQTQQEERFQENYRLRQRNSTEAAGTVKTAFRSPPPLPPEKLCLSAGEWTAALSQHPVIYFSPGPAPILPLGVLNFGGHPGHSFADTELQNVPHRSVFDAVVAEILAHQAAGRQVVLACWTEGSRERLKSILADHGMTRIAFLETHAASAALSPGTLGLCVLEMERGFEWRKLVLLSEQDILGTRLARPLLERRKTDFLTEFSTLSQDDLIVHVTHGIGRFAGLKTVQVMGASHDCLELTYAEGEKLYLPVENMELVTRYSGPNAAVQLDRLGSDAWRKRKARMKKQLLEIARDLIQTAAQRRLHSAPVLTLPEGSYKEFAARFPYEETEDQKSAIQAVLEDMASGRPMERLICGDVGFGKTEVALRAAFLAASSGVQTALLAPTTLLCRQHFVTFLKRFEGFPVRIGQISRLVSQAERVQVKKELADGSLNIVIGTHTLLGREITFKKLGLLMIDEEQHFGVDHKEKLKAMKTNLHVLTLTATPIPRTLQLALTDVCHLSLITTPPLGRRPVRSFTLPFDPLTLREALLREHARGGQSFFVCPRLSDLTPCAEFLKTHVPELSFAIAHGQMAPAALNAIMTAFYDQRYAILLSTNIVESGLDIPSANTLIVYRADHFGLAQLYQLKGRVGRSKQRGMAFFTVPREQLLTPSAQKRLHLLQGLDTLGAGFQLASHDLDLRGGGNLLGKEQSGHVRAVGFELYQQMLKEAVTKLQKEQAIEKRGEASYVSEGAFPSEEEHFVPQISLGLAVSIPEHYVPDLSLRMSLYRRLAALEEVQEIEAFAAEMIDRFGSLPPEGEALLQTARIKRLCSLCWIEKLDVGPKGALIKFHRNIFPKPASLLELIALKSPQLRVRSDQRLVLSWEESGTEARLEKLQGFLLELCNICKT